MTIPSFRWTLALLLSLLTGAASAGALTPTWQLPAREELRATNPPAIGIDDAGQYTYTAGPPARRAAIDPASGELSATLGTVGQALPLNGGGQDIDFRYNCDFICFPQYSELRRHSPVGELQWTRPLLPYGSGPIQEFPGRLVVADSAFVKALDATSGRLLWFKHAAGCQWQLVREANPASSATRLLRRRCGSRERLLQVDAEGRESWQWESPREVSAVVRLGGGRTVVVQPDASASGAAELLFLDLAGQVAARNTLPAALDGMRLPRMLAVDDDLLFMSPGNVVPRLWRIRGDTGAVRWQRDFPVPANGSFYATLLGVAKGQRLLLFVGRELHALDYVSGGSLWSVAADRANETFGALQFVDGRWSSDQLVLSSWPSQPSRWYGLDLESGQIRWRRDQVQLPTALESVATAMTDGSLVRVGYSAVDGSGPKLLIEHIGATGQLLRTVELTGLLAPGGQLYYWSALQSNQDRLLLEAHEEAGAVRILLDYPSFAVLDSNFSGGLAVDAGHYQAIDCGTECLRLRYSGSDTQRAWEAPVPSGFEPQQVHSGGFSAGDFFPKRFLLLDRSGQTLRSLSDWTLATPRLSANGDLLASPPDTNSLQRYAADTGQLLATGELGGVLNPENLVLAGGVVTVTGYSTRGLRSAAFLEQDLDPLFLLDGQWHNFRFSAERGTGIFSGLHVQQRDNLNMLDELRIEPGSVASVQLRTLLLQSAGGDRSPQIQPLVHGPGYLIAANLGRSRFYGAPSLSLAGYALAAPQRTANLRLEAEPLGEDGHLQRLRIHNLGPDATTASLHQLGTPVLSVIRCGGAAAATCARLQGVDLPAELMLAAGATAEFDLRIHDHLAYSIWPSQVSVIAYADGLTSELDRSDNEVRMSAELPLFKADFE